MADITKLKKINKGRRDELGAPPTIDEASTNLNAPEVAPVAPPPQIQKPQVQEVAPPIIDGRTLRRSKRTDQFTTRVTPEWNARIRTIAMNEGLLLIEVLEEALDAYEEKLGYKK